MKKKIVAFLLTVAMVFQTASLFEITDGVQAADASIEAQTEEILSKTYLTEEATFDGTANTRYAIPEEELALLKDLTSASVTIEFKTTSTGLQALAAVNGSAHTNDYISLYINGGTTVGIELRNHSTATTADVHYNATVASSFADGKWHAITLIVTENDSYKVYLDQELVLNQEVDTTYFAGTEGWWDAASVTFGGANRISGNSYLYTGSLKNAKVYTGAISEAQVLEDHANYKKAEVTEYPEGVNKTDEYGIFDMGDYEAFNYRIPAMVTTKNGVVIAAADQRNDHWSDWGNIDTVVRRSTDNGQTWEDLQDVIDLKSQPYNTGTQSAFLIDPVMIATEEGRVWMLVDMFPESTGTWSIEGTGTGYVEVDGVNYLALYDAEGNEYTLRGTEVYDKDGNKTSYTVNNGTAEKAYNDKGDMYDGDEYVGNIYLRSTSEGNDSAPLKTKKTNFLWLTYSDDDGETWSNPVDITAQIKENWMQFCGTGPGFGIELTSDKYEGRLVFPIYYTNSSSFQSSACIYSDDGGVTWTRGESPNDGRINSSGEATNSENPSGISQLTESQIIELSSGNLLQFMRNTGGSGKVVVSRSTDGGATWSDPINTTAPDVYCQLSVLHMDANGTDGKDRVLMSNSGGSGRNNGTLRIGEITETEDSFSVEWVEEKLFCPGNYAYSCLTRMADGNFGLLYEHNNTIKFTSFNEEYVTCEENLLSPTISNVTYSVEKETEHDYALPGDTYVFTVTLDKAVTVTGTPQLRFQIGGSTASRTEDTVTKYADFVSIDETGKVLTFEYVIQKGDEGYINYRGPKIVTDETSSVANASGYGVSAGDLAVSLGYIGVDPSDDYRDIPVSALTGSTGSAETSSSTEGGAGLTLDGNTSTMWHSDWDGDARENLWIQYAITGDYAVDGLRYYPRQSGGTNGIITEYEIWAGNDATFEDGTYAVVVEGAWAADTNWKLVSFDAVEADYIRLVAVNSISVNEGKIFASAAEIRLTGEEVVACDHTFGEWTVVTEATCTEAGSKERTCANGCGAKETETIAATGHSYGDWTVVIEATEDGEGLEKRVCACGAEETRVTEKLVPTTPEQPDQDEEQKPADKDKDSVNDSAKEEAKSPTTGDNTNGFSFAVIMLACVAIVTVMFRKRFAK